LGNPKDNSASMYGQDREKILLIQKIIATDLGYGKYLSLKAFISKLKEKV